MMMLTTEDNADDDGEDEQEGILSEYYALVCMHVETFKISDSPDVSLTQVYTKIILGYWHVTHVENHSRLAYLIFIFLNFNLSIICWIIVFPQIGVTTALNNSGHTKEEMLIPVKPSGLAGLSKKGKRLIIT